MFKFIFEGSVLRSSQGGLFLLPPTFVDGSNKVIYTQCHIISYPLFADVDTGIYRHAALQYHARPNAKRCIAMLSVDKSLYLWKQTKGNEFISCSNDMFVTS